VKNGHATKLAKKAGKRKRQPTVKQVGARVAVSLGAKPGTPELMRAVKFFNETDFAAVKRRIGSHLDTAHMALTGHIRVDDETCEECLKPGWWAAVTDDVGFAPVYVGGQPDRWFQARAEGTKRVNMIRIWADAKADVISQDGVSLSWVERK
jgi:hypothetical protein